MSVEGETRDLTRKGLTLVISASLHGIAVLGLLMAWREAPLVIEPEAISVELVDFPAPNPDPKPPAPPKTPEPKKPVAKPKPTKPVRPPPVHTLFRKVAAPRSSLVQPVSAIASRDYGPSLSDGQLAGASSAEGGLPGGACNMALMVQNGLRRDRTVQAALADMPPKAVMVWNGNWVRVHGEDGAGLAAIREAIMWEVGFAPEACKHQHMHGLILLSPRSDGHAARLAVGTGEWTWSDLIRTRERPSSER